MDTLDIPGYRAAVERETEAREFDFLDAPELLCGIEVMPLSIRRLLRLQAIRSPFLFADVAASRQSAERETPVAASRQSAERETPVAASRQSAAMDEPGDIALFFWALSPNYERALHLRHWAECCSVALGKIVFAHIRRRFVRRLRRLKLGEAADACRDCIARAFEDAPGGSNGGPVGPGYYGWPAGYVGLLATEYGWSEQTILDLPLRRLWQHVRQLILKKNDQAVLFNPSDRVRGDWLKKQNAAPGRN